MASLEEKSLDVNEAAARARVSKWTIYRAARTGKLHGTKAGGGRTTDWRFRHADVDRWVQGLPPRKGGAA